MLMFPVGVAVPVWLAWSAAYLWLGSPWWVVAAAGGMLLSGAVAMSVSRVTGRAFGVRAVGLLCCGLAIGCTVAGALAFAEADAGYGLAFLVAAAMGFVVQFALGTFLESVAVRFRSADSGSELGRAEVSRQD